MYIYIMYALYGTRSTHNTIMHGVDTQPTNRFCVHGRPAVSIPLSAVSMNGKKMPTIY